MGGAPRVDGRSLGAATPHSRRQFLRGSLALAGLGLLPGCGIAPSPAPTAEKTRRVGFLALGSSEPSPLFGAFRQGLAELGWVEGQNLVIDFRATGVEDRLPDLAAELVGAGVEIIVAVTAPAARAARQVTATTPIVMGASGDPVEFGLVASLAHPGGNVTGLSALSHQLSAKRLELLKEVAPAASRIAIIWNPAQRDKATDMQATERAAQVLGVQLLSFPVHSADVFEPAFEAAMRSGAAALITFTDSLTLLHRDRLAELAAKSRLPTMFEAREFAEAGGLMAHGPNLPDLFRRSATYVDRILRGAKPADLPVEQPTKFDFVVNLRTAGTLGLTIPPSVLMQATELIQ